MPPIAPRIPTAFAFTSAEEAVAHIKVLQKFNQFQLTIEAIAEIALRFSSEAQPFLELAYDIFQANPNQSRYHQYQARVFDFPIQPGDKVLDMGSGHIPFPLATHLADISLTDGRIGRANVPFKHVDGKPVFECSVEQTPFEDKEFDFVYCSHVLEHVNSPTQACKELMRIAKRGYIETPTKGKDVFLHMAEMSNHEQYVELVGSTLVFRRYQPWEKVGIGNNVLLNMHCSPQTAREKAFAVLPYLFPRSVNTMLMWEENFLFREEL